jgi:hypothetical protein
MKKVKMYHLAAQEIMQGKENECNNYLMAIMKFAVQPYR